MSAASTPRPAAARQTTPARPGQNASAEARRLAAVILEVLAGLRSPGEAAAVCALSLPRYYAAELRALHGLLAACEPRRPGRQASEAGELARLRQQCQLLQRQCDRQQALLRLAQRSIGLAPAPPPVRGKPAVCKAGKKRRRSRVRALRVIAALQQPATNDVTPPCQQDNELS
jgi:hypothetical protein